MKLFLRKRVIAKMPLSKGFLGFALVVCSVQTGCAVSVNTPKPTEPQILPLRSVRLYETGVGYFERSGSSLGGASLPVPSSHLDDALKTLVVLGAQGAPITGLSFQSRISAARARALVGLPTGDEPLKYRDLLASLKGEKIEIITTNAPGSPLLASVIEVVEEAKLSEPIRSEKNEASGKSGPPEKTTTLWLLYLGTSGELGRVRLDDLLSVRPVDPTVSSRLSGALVSLSPRASQIRRTLSVSGNIKGPITFGYVAEAPVWRPSYRIVLDDSTKSAQLQGWALVHNDTDENWNNVNLEVASGEPDSFLFPLAAPRYRHREVHSPNDRLSTLPQLGDSDADTLAGENIGHGSGTGVGYGYGSGSGRLSGSHSTRAPSVRMGGVSIDDRPYVSGSSLLEVGNLAPVATATAVEETAQSVYKIENPFSLNAHCSALVPIISKAIEIEQMVVFGSEYQQGRTSIRITNNTGSALPMGLMAVFARGGLVGESLFDRLAARESRLLSLGNEIDVVLSVKKVESTEQSKRVTFEKNKGLVEHFIRTTTEVLDVENRIQSPRTVWLSVHVDNNSKINGVEKVIRDESSSFPYAVFVANPRVKEAHSITILEGLSRTTHSQNINERVVKELANNPNLSAKEQGVLNEAAVVLAEETAQKEMASGAANDEKHAQQDLERLREHLKASGDKGHATVSPFVKRMIDAEDRLDAAKKRRVQAEKNVGEKHEKALRILARLAP